MVQFVFTPWRDRAELLRVRAQLYPRLHASSPTTADDDRPVTATAAVTPPPSPWWSTPEELRAIEAAVARVMMWTHRGGCPHVVESTALLMSAMVFDARGGHDAVAWAAVAAGYLVGFTRFVTGLLDGHQDKARKLSMYGVAKTIGLPAAFVELRHQGTHEPMPSLAQLRPAAARALVWIWDYYWKNLPGEEQEDARGQPQPQPRGQGALGDHVAAGGERGKAARGEGEEEEEAGQASMEYALKERMCRAALVGYLQRQEGEVGEGAAREGLLRQLERWDEGLVMRVLADVGAVARDGGMLLRAVKLSASLLGRDAGPAATGKGGEGRDEASLRLELARAREEAERRSALGKVTGKRKKGEEEGEGEEMEAQGWFRWKGPWEPKPIGVL